MTFTKKAIRRLWLAMVVAVLLMASWPTEAYTDLDAKGRRPCLRRRKPRQSN